MKRKYVKTTLIVLAVLFNMGIAYWYSLPKNRNITSQQLTYTDSVTSETPIDRLYGLAIDSFTIETNTVKRNQNLGSILEAYPLPDRALTQLMLYCDKIFDVRKIRHGNNYTAFLSKDTVSRLQYLVYEHSPVEYVVFSFTDSVKVALKEREVTTIQNRVSGSITSSLWEAIKENNINPLVAIELNEMYAWTVDFFGLQQGDHFTVVYDELFVDTVSVGIGKVHVASFNHAGKELLAIPFMQDNVVTFYDADGNSLKRAFLKAPLKAYRISSKFSGSRMHPILKIRRPHYGVDYAAPVGTPVYSVGDGRVIMAGYQKGAGRIIKVRHNGVYTTTYMHLSRFASGLSNGSYVRQGEVIGYVGSSGLSTGPHLDFRVSMNGNPIDPLKMVSPPVEPVKLENKEAFDAVKRSLLSLLNGVDQTDFEDNLQAYSFIPESLLFPSFLQENPGN
jgi:murein DD-endopeptidase MepM/ murein hydrolase activator NlpD